MQAIMRQDELEDVVGVISQTFLGLTAHCARCHDHKFDPIRQADYYKLTSAIAGYSHGERKTPLGRDAVPLDARIAAVRRQLRAIEDPIRKRLLAERRGKPRDDDQGPPAPTPLAAWDFSRGFDNLAEKSHGSLEGDAKIVDGALRLSGGGYLATATLDREIREKTLEAIVSLDNLDQQGGAAISLQRTDGSAFDAIVFGERERGRWMAGSNSFVRTRAFGGPEETEASNRPVHVALVYRSDGTIAAYRDGKPYGEHYDSGELAVYPAGQAQVLIGLRHSPPGGNRYLTGAVRSAALYDRALSEREVADLARRGGAFVTADEVLAALPLADRRRHDELSQSLAALESRRAQLTARQVYACVPQSAAVGRVLVRGNPQQPADVVAPGGVPTLRGVDADFGLPPDAPEAERRVKLAAWITDPANPLFARVVVNRLWHYHFGLGLVDTPNDFGFSGGRPTHPELLDYLADQFVRSGFGPKAMHRAIAGSATYRQTSAGNAGALGKDAENRWLWRKTPRRLEAEVVRDAMLVAAGELNAAMGGPGFHDFRAYMHRTTQFYEPIDVAGPDVQRRTIYRTWARGGRNPFLDTLDCPDPSTTTPDRSVTTTPLQAMAMWNNAFVLRMADAMAARIELEVGDNISRQIDRAYWLAVSRSASDDERDAIGTFVERHGLAALCRVLLNSNEFMYVD
jgi:hypothetical protein